MSRLGDEEACYNYHCHFTSFLGLPKKASLADIGAQKQGPPELQAVRPRV